jgi:hypothetical protein
MAYEVTETTVVAEFTDGTTLREVVDRVLKLSERYNSNAGVKGFKLEVVRYTPAAETNKEVRVKAEDTNKSGKNPEPIVVKDKTVLKA